MQQYCRYTGSIQAVYRVVYRVVEERVDSGKEREEQSTNKYSISLSILFYSVFHASLWHCTLALMI